MFLPQLVRGRLAVQTQQSPAPCGVGSHIRMVVDPLDIASQVQPDHEVQTLAVFETNPGGVGLISLKQKERRC